MYHDGKCTCTSKFEFSGKWQRGNLIKISCSIYVTAMNGSVYWTADFNQIGQRVFYLSHAGYKFSVRTSYNQRTFCKIFKQFFFNIYFVVMILNNRMMIWIKNIFKKIVLLLNKSSSACGKNLSSICLQWKKQKRKNIHQYFLTQVASNKVILFTGLRCLWKKDIRSQLINFLCFSPVHHSHLAKTVNL